MNIKFWKLAASNGCFILLTSKPLKIKNNQKTSVNTICQNLATRQIEIKWLFILVLLNSFSRYQKDKLSEIFQL